MAYTKADIHALKGPLSPSSRPGLLAASQQPCSLAMARIGRPAYARTSARTSAGTRAPSCAVVRACARVHLSLNLSACACLVRCLHTERGPASHHRGSRPTAPHPHIRQASRQARSRAPAARVPGRAQRAVTGQLAGAAAAAAQRDKPDHAAAAAAGRVQAAGGLGHRRGGCKWGQCKWGEPEGTSSRRRKGGRHTPYDAGHRRSACSACMRSSMSRRHV